MTLKRQVIFDPDDEIGVLGIFLGHFDNGTGLSEEELYERQVENKKKKVYDE